MCPELVEENMTVFQYDDNVDGAILTISCLEGYSLPEGMVESVCGSDGSWSPDPNEYKCVKNQGLCTASYAGI